jgi:hypothetical protein
MYLPSGWRVLLEDGDGTINVLIGPPLSCLGVMTADGKFLPAVALTWYG